MPELRFDHVSFMVEDLDASVEKWKKILSVLDPEQAQNVSYGGGTEGGEEMRWATFVKPGGTVIQLFQPMSEDGYLMKILRRRGEHIHHIAFLSSDVDATVQDLREAGFPIVQEENTAPDTMPWLKWNFIPPDFVGGTLIEVAQRYANEGDRWVPVPGDPQ